MCIGGKIQVIYFLLFFRQIVIDYLYACYTKPTVGRFQSVPPYYIYPWLSFYHVQTNLALRLDL